MATHWLPTKRLVGISEMSAAKGTDEPVNRFVQMARKSSRI